MNDSTPTPTPATPRVVFAVLLSPARYPYTGIQLPNGDVVLAPRLGLACFEDDTPEDFLARAYDAIDGAIRERLSYDVDVEDARTQLLLWFQNAYRVEIYPV